MNRLAVLVFAFTLALRLPIAAAEKKLNVVATTPDFGSLAREIGGDRVDVSVLAQPAEDAHFVTPKPSFIARLSRADLLIEGGAELEIGWMPPLLDGARNSKLAAGQPAHVACAEGLALLEVPRDADRSHGDIHAMGNPHYMVDPVNARHVAERICKALEAVDGANSGAYRERLQSFTTRLDAKLAVWQAQLAPFQGKRIVAFHNSWPYFAARFGLRIDLFLEPKPGIPPSPAHLASVVTTMKAEKIGVIIVEPHHNRKTAETVAAKTGAVLVDFSQYPGGLKGTEGGYIELLDQLVSSLAAAFQARRGGVP